MNEADFSEQRKKLVSGMHLKNKEIENDKNKPVNLLIEGERNKSGEASKMKF